ncbi:hypothetical protein IHE44_0013476, partial [Lamprotornis superbus]
VSPRTQASSFGTAEGISAGEEEAGKPEDDPFDALACVSVNSLLCMEIDINTAGPGAQALTTPGSARAPSTTEPGPGHTRKARSCIMTGRTVAAVLILLLVSALGTQGEPVPRSAIELRCHCISTHSRFIHPKFIQNVNLTPSGPHCKNVEVIATLRDGREVCLEPTAPWVKLIIKTILDKASLEDGREVCVEPTAPWVRLAVKALLARVRRLGTKQYISRNQLSPHTAGISNPLELKLTELDLSNSVKNSCPTMNSKLVAVLALFLISAAVSQGRTLARMGTELRCQCIATHSKFIPPKTIQDVKLTQSGPHCKNVEVIATLKDGKEVCLEPTAPWVQRIIKAILARSRFIQVCKQTGESEFNCCAKAKMPIKLKKLRIPFLCEVYVSKASVADFINSETGHDHACQEPVESFPTAKVGEERGAQGSNAH